MVEQNHPTAEEKNEPNQDAGFSIQVSDTCPFGQILNKDNQPYLHERDSAQYDAIAELLISYVQSQMTEVYGLEKVMIAEDHHLDPKFLGRPKAPIFMSPAFRNEPQNNKGKKALVLIQGSGAVRAGIWARSVCINEGLARGSMLPFLDICR